MRGSFSPFHLFLLGFLILGLIVSLQFGLMTLSFEKLGLSSDSATLLLFTSLLGSLLNLPLMSMESEAPAQPLEPFQFGLLRGAPEPFTGRTVIAVNVGGCLVPLFFCAYLLRHHSLDPMAVALGVAAVSAVSYAFSRPIPGLGIGMPIFIAPVTAALVSLMLDGELRAPLAYISGSLGVLLGADVLRLKDIRAMGVPVAAIGGAGTFDGIFMTGIVAVLLS
ncbi:DUF1614 domain-containing protein [Methylogaea oryzae]|uniref:DUF1614 domain-containing protein n=1 Tax=Methylogaea oryzae TaxID=1295382 RepID=A0A8D5AHB5_9GAMM|nr:DUF1614 domain-containing protein [Methylogaea oryzae]BBL70106.1 hypothetical protein MoryE10_07120 [Methylogaea oryzae]